MVKNGGRDGNGIGKINESVRKTRNVRGDGVGCRDFEVGTGLFSAATKICVGRRLETMRSMKWPGGKLNEWFSSQGAPLNNLPAVPARPFPPSPFPPSQKS